ncbi:MAG: helix-turn-helix domain-containing protein [Prolixibacteraceae bacterium]|nr:helix-turn-helix domain-containing protein [Prolixibacteraceae bacterium]
MLHRFDFMVRIPYFYCFNDKNMLKPEVLANIIRKHRKAAGLSQLQLAEMAGVGKTVVFDLEKGKESVQLNTLRKILKVLNIHVQLTSQIMDQILSDENS